MDPKHASRIESHRSQSESFQGRMSAPTKRTLPDSVDYKSPRKAATRDFYTGVRSYIKVSKNPHAYGYKLNIKIDLPREEGKCPDIR